MTDQPPPRPSSTFSPIVPAGKAAEISTSRTAHRKKASTACSACKLRRSRCTEGVPCIACITHHTECIKDEIGDGRRRVAVKRKLDGLEEDRQRLEGLLRVLKCGDSTQVESLIARLQASSSSSALRASIDESIESHKNATPLSPEIQQKTDAPAANDQIIRGRHRTGAISDLLNPPLSAPAKPWTKVTDDDDLVSHLLSLWFTWIHPSFRWVEREPFLEAMRRGDVHSPLCTSYLVNSILAEACLLDRATATKNHHASRLRLRFLSEAQAGMEAERGRVSLAIVQAQGVLWSHLYLHGEDRLGRIVLNTQLFHLKSIDHWREKLSQRLHATPSVLQDIDKTLHFVRWTLFTLNAFNLADYRKFRRDITCDQSISSLPHGEAPRLLWSPYPLHGAVSAEFHADCHFLALASLAQKVAENEDLSVKREQGIAEDDTLHHLIHDLQEWPSRLPVCMQLHPQATPHVLLLHALHNWTELVLAKQAAAAEAGRPGQPVITITPASSYAPYWHRSSILKSRNIAEIMLIYYSTWGTRYLPPLFMQPISSALFSLMEDLGQKENQAAFISLLKLLQAASLEYRVGKGTIKVLVSTARHQRIQLPAEAAEILSHISSHEMTAGGENSNDEGTEHALSSPESEITVDYLLEKWSDLDPETDHD